MGRRRNFIGGGGRGGIEYVCGIEEEEIIMCE